MPEITFQAAIWQGESSQFRVQMRPYQGNATKTYMAMMNAEKLADFIALCGTELNDVSEAISSTKALVLEGMEVDDANGLAGFGFSQQQGAGK
jgi:hypothetical protein